MACICSNFLRNGCSDPGDMLKLLRSMIQKLSAERLRPRMFFFVVALYRGDPHV
jgi:hypothetical protein